MLHWPEANVLLDPAHRSATAATPAYKGGAVRVRPVAAAAAGEQATDPPNALRP